MAFSSLTFTEVLVPTLEIKYAASSKNHWCSKDTGSFPRPKPELRWPAPVGQLFPEGPRGWVLPDVGSWCKSLQAEGAGSLSAQALTLDSPPLASVPTRLLSLLPTQRMSAPSAHPLLAEAVRGRHPPRGAGGALRVCLVQALPPDRTMSQRLPGAWSCLTFQISKV